MASKKSKTPKAQKAQSKGKATRKARSTQESTPVAEKTTPKTHRYVPVNWTPKLRKAQRALAKSQWGDTAQRAKMTAGIRRYWAARKAREAAEQKAAERQPVVAVA